jgi:hypothetical protein
VLAGRIEIADGSTASPRPSHRTVIPFNKENVVGAGRVVSVRPGTPHPGRSTNPKAALGLPDCLNSGTQPGTYYSLGYGGELIVEFRNHLLHDGEGADLVIVEVGYPAEPVDVSVSEDGKSWNAAGRSGRDVMALDLATCGLSGRSFRFVRIVDTKTKISGKPEFWGADIDAIVALQTVAAQ